MRFSLLVVLLLSVATCGQKGPLRLPEPEAQAPAAAFAAVTRRQTLN